MHKILIVEDDPLIQEMYQRDLGGFDIVPALSLEEGRGAFSQFASEIKAVVLDGSLGSGEFGHVLAKEIRDAGYTGPMIACSSLAACATDLREGGCDHAVGKGDLGNYLKRLLSVA